MIKYLLLLFSISIVYGMEEPPKNNPTVQQRLEQIRTSNNPSHKKLALDFVDGKIDESSFLKHLHSHETQDLRVAQLLRIQQTCFEAMKKGDPAELKLAIDYLLDARASLSYLESWHVWLSNDHRHAVEFIQKPRVPFDHYNLNEVFTTRKDLTATQVAQLIQQVRRVEPAIDRSIKDILCSKKCLVHFENSAVLQGMVQAEVIDAKTLYARLNHVMAKTFVDRNPDVACEEDLLALSLKIDQEACHAKIKKYSEVDPTISKELHEMTQRLNALKISESIRNIKALREAIYNRLKQKGTEGAILKPLCFWLHQYTASPGVADKSYPVTQIEWFVSKAECNLDWFCTEQGPYQLTTPLDLLLIRRRYAQDILEHVNLLLSHKAGYIQNHQKQLEDDVIRLGRCGQKYNGLVTPQERAAAQESSKYKRAVDLLALLYPQSPQIIAKKR